MVALGEGVCVGCRPLNRIKSSELDFHNVGAGVLLKVVLQVFEPVCFVVWWWKLINRQFMYILLVLAKLGELTK